MSTVRFWQPQQQNPPSPQPGTIQPGEILDKGSRAIDRVTIAVLVIGGLVAGYWIVKQFRERAEEEADVEEKMRRLVEEEEKLKAKNAERLRRLPSVELLRNIHEREMMKYGRMYEKALAKGAPPAKLGRIEGRIREAEKRALQMHEDDTDLSKGPGARDG